MSAPTSARPPRRIHPAWLLGALALTLVAAYFAPEAEHGGVVLSERAAAVSTRAALAPATPTTPATPAAANRVAAITPNLAPNLASNIAPATTGSRVLSVADREAFTGEDALFKGLPAAPAQAPRAPAAPPPQVAPNEPEVPRLPLKMIGRYVDNGAPAAFVLMQDQSLVLRVGDAVADGFRVDHIDEASVTVRHLATEQRQSFRLDAAP